MEQLIEILAKTNIDSLGYVLILLGILLFIGGLNIIKIQKLTIKPGAKTWIAGMLLTILGLTILLLPLKSKPVKYFYVCYDKKEIINEMPEYTNCSQENKSCITIDKKKFGRYLTEKDSYRALERCYNNIPR